MSLELMYITNKPAIALIAEQYGVSRIWIDLETLGKEERQKNLDTVKSHHTIDDVGIMSKVLKKSELMVRINPWNKKSKIEIDKLIELGTKRIMLPMWKSFEEVDCFLNHINKRVATTLLLETKEAVLCVDDVLKHPLIDEIHIGLNDLHLSYGLDFMFELLSNGTVESLCKKFKERNIKYGFGGIAKIGEGMLPAEKIVMEHYRLGSTRVILSRSFCDYNKMENMDVVNDVFRENIGKLRSYENEIKRKSPIELNNNANEVCNCVDKIVNVIKRGN